MAWRCPIAAAGRRAIAPRARRCGSHPRDPFAAIYCGVAAYCQFVGRNYEEAIRLSREALRQRADFVGAHRVLTAALGMAGDTDAAKAALEGLRRAQPNISLAWLASGCRSSTRRTRRIIWRGFGGRGWGRGLQRPRGAGFRSSRPAFEGRLVPHPADDAASV